MRQTIRFIWFLALFLAIPCRSVVAQPSATLCMGGTLLFREDFGGNDVNDPVAGTNPAPGMTSSYIQIFDTAECHGRADCVGMGSGRYLLTKIGYRNAASYTYSHWFIMDDHTYPNDYTRGYLLEIDGRTDDATLFETVMDGLCEGSRLTFSAYVTNITTAYSYDHGNNGDPELSFIFADPETDVELQSYKTGPIPVDRSFQNVSGEWRNSAHWNLVGTTFTVPPGRTAVKLIIKNACTAYNGNDFAMDDIEVHFCYPEGEILGEPSVCQGSSVQLEASWEATGDMVEPFEFKWWHSLDSITWTEISGVSTFKLSLPSVQKSDYGWYKAAMAEVGNIERVNCRTLTKPFKLTDKQCSPSIETPDLCLDGTLLFREDFGGNEPGDPRIGTEDVVGMDPTYDHLLDDYFGSMHGGAYLLTKQGYCNGDTSINNLPQNRGSQWHLQDDHTYPDDTSRGYLLEIDGRGDNAAFYTKTLEGLCEGTKLTFTAYVANVMTWGQYEGSPGKFSYPNLRFVLTDPVSGTELASRETGEIPYDDSYSGDYKCWQHSAKWNLVGMPFVVPDGVSAVKLTIYNNVDNSIGNDFAMDDIEIRLCMPPIEIKGAAKVCEEGATTLKAVFDEDVLDNPEYQWFFSSDGNSYAELSGAKEASYSIADAQSSDAGWYTVAVAEQGQLGAPNCHRRSEPFLLAVEQCQTPPPPCPDLVRETRDTTVCNTLLPFRWYGELFTEPGDRQVLLQDQQGCDSIEYTLHLGTTMCTPEKHGCDSILVNKYDWVLLVNNVRVRELYPDSIVTGYQWFKNGEQIEDAVEDDYSEQDRLVGSFQVLLTFAGGDTICSNIIEILPEPEPPMTMISVYNSTGLLVRQWQTMNEHEQYALPKGIYLLRIERGKEVKTGKLCIP